MRHCDRGARETMTFLIIVSEVGTVGIHENGVVMLDVVFFCFSTTHTACWNLRWVILEPQLAAIIAGRAKSPRLFLCWLRLKRSVTGYLRQQSACANQAASRNNVSCESMAIEQYRIQRQKDDDRSPIPSVSW